MLFQILTFGFCSHTANTLNLVGIQTISEIQEDFSLLSVGKINWFAPPQTLASKIWLVVLLKYLMLDQDDILKMVIFLLLISSPFQMLCFDILIS